MNFKHGKSHTPEHVSWSAMRQRVLNPKDPAFKNYGGRGVTICPEWRDDFEQFLRDMGPRPLKSSLDRVDNDGPYSPSNCRWATKREQDRNKRQTRWITMRGKTQTLTEWAQELGIPRATFHYWVRRARTTYRTPKELSAIGCANALVRWMRG